MKKIHKSAAVLATATLAGLLLIILFSFYAFPNTLINWPLNLPKSLSATLGEIRGSLLHQGIDIKTNGRKGYPVFAAGEGRISRIISGGNGYGNAVFLDHRNGIESVYGHLNSFEEGNHRLDSLIRTLKVINNTEYLDFKFTGEQLCYKTDEKIAYAGEAGSGFPHLHFEIRENDEFQNPLDYLHIRDTEPPVIEGVFVCAEKNNTTVYEKKAGIKKNRGAYVTINDQIGIDGDKIFFKISCYDRVGAANHVAPYRLQLYEDQEKAFEIAFDSMAKSELVYGPHIYDISKSTINGGVSYVYFLCRREENNYSGIKTSGDGYINFRGKNKKEISISVSDFAGNENSLKFKIIQKNILPATEDYIAIESKTRYDCFSKNKNLQIIIPENAVHNKSLIKIEDSVYHNIFDFLCKSYGIPVKNIYSIFSISPHDAVYKRPIKVLIKKPPEISEEDIKHTLIFHFFEGKKPNVLKTRYIDRISKFEAESYTNGFFALIKDNNPPKIFLPPTFEFVEDMDIYRTIRLYTSDNISKIKIETIQCILDGELYPSFFDEDRKWIEIKLPKAEFSKGMHHIFVKLSDEANNDTVFRGLLSF